MAMSQDSDLTAYVPDILSLGISAFTNEHARSQGDVERRLRADWWTKTGRSGEMDTTLLTESQWTRCAAYRVLSAYALPQLSTWRPDDRFTAMIEFYEAKYEEEFQSVLRDGVEYDYDEDSSIADSEKAPIHHGRLYR